MIKSTIKHALTAVALAASAVGSANAFVISAGNIKITIDNYDVGNVGYSATTGTPCVNDPAACDAASLGGTGAGSFDTAGIFSVALITNTTTGQTIFTKGTDGYLTGVFGGLLDQTVDTQCSIITGSCTTTALSIGGFVNLYKNASDYNPALGPNGAGVDLVTGLYPGITDNPANLWLSAVFATGAVLAGNATTSYMSTYNTSSFAGAGQAFLDVTGGAAYDNFNTNKLTDANGNKRDLFLDVTYNDANGAASSLGWTVASTGSVKGNAIPEPGALALIALGLLGAGAATRRKA